MIYRSNLTAPDLYHDFAPRVVCKPRHNSLGHDVLSDPAREPECGFLTHDEAAILFNVAKAFPGTWLDIGGAAGWSAAHIALVPRTQVITIDPIYSDIGSIRRMVENNWRLSLWDIGDQRFIVYSAHTANSYFAANTDVVDGVLIDGDHSAPEPLNDAKNAAAHLAERGVIVLHDVLGGPVQEAVVWLLDNGFRARIYWTPHVMAVCWRGEFEPPPHIPDPQIEPKLRPQMAGFPFERCS